MASIGNLVLIHQKEDQVKHSVQPGHSLLLGTDRSCDVVLKERGVSRKHCRIECVEHWQVLDLGSTNGIILNGKSFGGQSVTPSQEPISLSDGDHLEIGQAIFTIEIDTSGNFTELLEPKNLPNAGNESTEMLTPTQKRQGEPLKESRKRPSLPDRASANPMNQPNTFFAQPQSKSKSSTESKRGNDRSSNEPERSAPSSTFGIAVPGDFRNYRLDRRVGMGGMGEVFLAYEKSAPSRLLAIKFLKQKEALSSMDRSRFLREMEIALTMQHSALIRCVDCGQEEGQLFIVMDYCNGGNLSELLARSGKLTVRRAVRLMHRLLAGVDYAHQLGIVHRDLKPSNVLLHKESNGKYVPRISDFGLAKSYLQAGESGMTVNGAVGGSWGYMPKEQLTNFRFVLPQSDVWSLGAILYESLSLRLPRPIARGADAIRTILESNVIPIQNVVSDIDPHLARFVMKSLAREANDRFENAGAMRTALIATADQIGIEL